MLSSQKSPTVIVLIGVSALIWAFAIITLMPSLGGTIDVQAHEVCTHEIGTWEAVSTAPYAHVESKELQQPSVIRFTSSVAFTITAIRCLLQIVLMSTTSQPVSGRQQITRASPHLSLRVI